MTNLAYAHFFRLNSAERQARYLLKLLSANKRIKRKNMNPFKILIFAIIVNLAFAADASKDVNLTADDARNQKEIKILETLCGSILPFGMVSCEQLADKRLDENSAFYDRQKGLAALQKVCDSKDESDSKLACTKLACESGDGRKCLNAAKYYQTLLSVNEKMSALFQKTATSAAGRTACMLNFLIRLGTG